MRCGDPVVKNIQSRVATHTGLGFGTVGGSTAQATLFRLGSYTLPGPIVGCCGAADGTSELVGNDTLKFFTVTFDYDSARMFIEPNAALPKRADLEYRITASS
jgi:hypothetical protein